MEIRNFLKEVIERVPAYKDFALKQGFNASTPWEEIPLTDKQSYLLKYSLPELCWDKDLSRAHLIGASSGFGKSGSVFWPKRPEDEMHYISSIETMLVENYHIDKKRTLILVCIAFGTWIGGMQIATAIRSIACEHKHPVTCATPGLNLQEAVEIYKLMEPYVEQTLIMTNPSNITVLWALFKRDGLKMKGNIFFPVVGEYISEEMRKKVCREFGHAIDSPFVVWTGYGSADTGDIGVETEATMRLRRFIYEHSDDFQDIFNTKDTPMIFEFSSQAFIEIIDEEIIVTKDQLVPLVRYNTKDCGGILELSHIKDRIPSDLVKKLPDKMLFVYGRTGDSIIFYGTNLSVGDMQNYFLSLDKDFHYGGLFQVVSSTKDDIPVFNFIFYLTEHYDSEDMRTKYKNALLKYLLNSSNEFRYKYNHLYSLVGEDLINVELRDIKTIEGKLKHKYIL